MANFEEVSASSVDGFSSRAEDDYEGTTSGSDGGDLETLPDEVLPSVSVNSPPTSSAAGDVLAETPEAVRERAIRQLVEAEFAARMPAKKKGGRAASKKASSPKQKKPAKQGKSKTKTSKKGSSKASTDNVKYRRLAAQILKIGT